MVYLKHNGRLPDPAVQKNRTIQHNTTQRKAMKEFTINTIERDINDHRTRVFPATIVISAQTFNEAVHKVLNRPQIRVQQIVSVNGKNFSDCPTD
jgi:hypothetical protein